jgi:hypothetical protein
MAPDVAAANIIASLLETQGITAFVPDANTASIAWHLSGALGGIRVQVREKDLDRAKEVLSSMESKGSTSEAPADGEKLALRAYRTAVVGFLLWPVLHPYALSLSISALKDQTLAPAARRKARWAAALSVFSMSLLLVLIAVLKLG